jgi:Zn-finger nucleic acid-binding protein
MRLEQDRDCQVCDFCGNIHVPELNADGIRVFDEPAGLACPLCAIPLVYATADGLRIRHCTRCHGLLIPMDTFLAIVRDLRSRRESTADGRPFDLKALDRRIRCPRCDQEMDTHVYGGGGNVVIDSCENCCLNWLDYSELDRIVRAPDRDYSENPRTPVK